MTSHQHPMSRMLILSWLALLLAGITTGDLVVDLVFEQVETDISDAGLFPSEEPENSAEHVLLPSTRTTHTDERSSPLPAAIANPVILSSLDLLSSLGGPHLYLRASLYPRSPASIQVLRI